VNLKAIREYLEERYEVDLSDVKIVHKWRAFVPRYRPQTKTITYSKFLAPLMFGMGLGLLIYSLLRSFIAGIFASFYILANSACLGSSRAYSFSHEYSHTAHHKRIEKYFSLLKKGVRSEGERVVLEGEEVWFHLPSEVLEEVAEMEGYANPFVPRSAKIFTKVLSYLGPDFSKRKRKMKKLFKALEQMNPGKPSPRELNCAYEKIERGKINQACKEVMKELISKEYEEAERTGWLDWVKSCPSLIPEKHHLLSRLISSEL
jgi:hypothetical protein